jgi:hypothetical protein
MTTETNQKRLNRRQVLALRGLRLPSPALKMLREAGIYCEPAVSIEYQHLAKRYVLLGRESGGAVAQVGAYCGFVDVTGERLEWLTRVDSVGRNGIHATVVAPSMVRVQLFRVAQTFELLITRHELIAHREGIRPALESHIIFHGTHGTYPTVLVVGSNLNDLILPEFLGRAGDPLPVPLAYVEAVRSAITGTHSFGCRTPHLLMPRRAVTSD